MSGRYCFDLMGPHRSFDVLSLLTAKSGGIAQNIERIFGLLDLGGQLVVSAVGENAAQLVRNEVSWEAGEDTAHWAVEVQEQGFSIGQDAAQQLGVVDWGLLSGHRLYSVLIVFHMLSNHVRAWSTY